MADETDGFEVTRRRALGGLLTLGVASAAGGAGTMAYFSDTESSTDNTVQAGTLDLSENGAGSNVAVAVSNVAPGDLGSESVPLANDGSLQGYLRFGLVGFRTPENGVNEPEADASAEDDSPGSNSGDGHTGELAEHLRVRAKLVRQDDSPNDESLLKDDTQYVIGDTDTWEQASNLTLGPHDLSDFALASGETVDFVMEYEVDSGAGNEIQSDGLAFDATFGLAQETGQSVLDDAREVPASAVGPSGGKAGVEFDFTNPFGQQATITAVHVQPENTSLTLLSDNREGTNYDDYTYDADVHIEASGGDRDGWVDGGPNEFNIPGWIDLGDDGWGPSAEQEAVLSAGSTATVHLYAFRDASGKVDMTDKRVRVTFDVTLADRTRSYAAFVMTAN